VRGEDLSLHGSHADSSNFSLFLSHTIGVILRFEEARRVFLMKKNPLRVGEKTFPGPEEAWVETISMFSCRCPV